MLLGVEGLGLPSRPLARPSPYFVRDLWGGGSPPTWGSGSRNMGVIFLTPVPPPTPFSICLSLSHTHFLSLKFPGSSKKQRQHLFTVRMSGLRADSFWSPFLDRDSWRRQDKPRFSGSSVTCWLNGQKEVN